MNANALTGDTKHPPKVSPSALSAMFFAETLRPARSAPASKEVSLKSMPVVQEAEPLEIRGAAQVAPEVGTAPEDLE